MAGPVEQDDMLIEWDVAIVMDDGLLCVPMCSGRRRTADSRSF